MDDLLSRAQLASNGVTLLGAWRRLVHRASRLFIGLPSSNGAALAKPLRYCCEVGDELAAELVKLMSANPVAMAGRGPKPGSRFGWLIKPGSGGGSAILTTGYLIPYLPGLPGFTGSF
jgi:hypothetical protein